MVGHVIEKRLDQLDTETLLEPVSIPVFSGFGLECYSCTYQAQTLILHHGATPQEGHYTTLLRGDEALIRQDDARMSTEPIPSPPLSDLCECYLILLTRLVVA